MTKASQRTILSTRQSSPLEKHLQSLLAKRQAQSRLRILKSSPPGSIDFSSNDFLSLSTTPQFRTDYLQLLNQELQYTPVGSTGSRLLDGNSTYAEALERRIAAFHGAETALLTNSGFDANVSIFTTIPQQGDVIAYDELIHASVWDGMRQSRVQSDDLISFKHNSVQDLRHKLLPFSSISVSSTSSPRSNHRKARNIFIAVESVYSMDGDLAPLRDIVDLVDELFPTTSSSQSAFTTQAYIIVDEAHSTGLYGLQGRGLVSALSLESRIFIRLHTFGKALACNGAAILCSPTIRSYLINYARPLIYTTFMSYPNLVAVQNAYNWMESSADMLSGQLFGIIRYLHDQLRERLLPILAHSESNSGKELLTLSETCPQSPIFALLTSQPRELAKFCQDAGFVVRAVVPPTVPPGTERVRVCLHAGNTRDEVDAFVQCVERWLMIALKVNTMDSRQHIFSEMAHPTRQPAFISEPEAVRSKL